MQEIDAIMHKNAAWPFDAENDGWNRMHVALTLASGISSNVARCLSDRIDCAFLGRRYVCLPYVYTCPSCTKQSEQPTTVLWTQDMERIEAGLAAMVKRVSSLAMSMGAFTAQYVRGLGCTLCASSALKRM
jgi:hypothetical protein